MQGLFIKKQTQIMKKQINDALDYIKKQDINGCITGSVLLEIFPDSNQDIDVFVYDEASFNKLLYSMHFNSLFQLIEPIEQWKFEEWINKKQSSLKKLGLVTIKFKYNLSIDVNIIYKTKNKNVFDVISSFDLDIIAKGYDIQTKKYLDLSEGLSDKKTSWNKWNTAFYAEDIWSISRLLRQFQRCIKYHKRGYDTDEVVLKYMELLNKLVEYENIFNSVNFKEKVKDIKANSIILKNIFELWLENHKLSEEEYALLEQKIKEL